MKIITGFESEPLHDRPEEEQVINEDFIKVFKALEHSLEVAENAFTRAAKRSFRQYTEGGSFTESKDAREMSPVWVTDVSVVIPATGFDEAARATELQQLVVMLGEAFKSTVDEPTQVALIDPLKCHIQKITDRDYRFSIKQMWAPHE